jgi:hypothetical protein
MEAHRLQPRVSSEEGGWAEHHWGNIHLHFSFSSEHVISPEYGSSRGTMRKEKVKETWRDILSKHRERKEKE